MYIEIYMFMLNKISDSESESESESESVASHKLTNSNVRHQAHK